MISSKSLTFDNVLYHKIAFKEMCLVIGLKELLLNVE